MNHVSPSHEPDVLHRLGDKPKLAWIDKRALIIDERYQRSIETKASVRLINYLRANFTWVKCLPLVITDNGDGTYCVIDGQHRLEAVRDLDFVTDMPCYVLGEMTLQEQALAFVDLNVNRVSVTPLAVHHARAKAGDPVAAEMERVSKAAGCRIRKSAPAIPSMKNGDLVCLGTLKAGIRRHGSPLVINALMAVRKAWLDTGGIRGEILQGAIDFLVKGGDVQDLLFRLQRKQPDQIIAQALARRAMNPLHGLNAYVLAVISENRGRK